MLVPALSRCCSGVRVLVGCEAKRFRRLRNGKGWIGDRLIGDGSRDGVLMGVAPRDRSCTRRDRTGGGAIALTRWKERLLRSSARSGSVPLLHHFIWGGGQRAFAESGMGRVCLGTGCLGMGNRGGVLLGVALRDRSCTRRDRTGGGAIALTRWKERLLRSSARSGSVPLPRHFI